MIDILALTLAGETPPAAEGATAAFRWQWHERGVVEFIPHGEVNGSLVLSTGIHGNETAPVEMVAQLLADLFSGVQPLRWRLLVIFGNPPALAANKRYLHHDMNRMFGGRWKALPQGYETARAARLEAIVAAFYSVRKDLRWHLDLHTAIRDSHHVRFGVLPARTAPWDEPFLRWLGAAGLEALVYHQQPGGTFSHFSCEHFHALACTLELGKALPFGHNDGDKFATTRQALEQLVSGRIAEAAIPLQYLVAQQLTRHGDAFRLYMGNDTPNFTSFAPGTLLAEEGEVRYRVGQEVEYVLFPNPNVAPGLRAGLMLVRRE